MAEETVLHHPEIETGHEPFMPADEFASNSPMKVSYGKMMMWYFLLSDALKARRESAGPPSPHSMTR